MQTKKYIQLSAGQGPAECCWVVAQVLKKLLKEAKSYGVTTEVVHREEGVENNTLLSAVVQLESTDLSEFLARWVGSVLWVGQSKYRKFHKRKNWFIGIQEVFVGQAALQIKESDIKYDAIRAGGPGGQHVNKVSTAIRAKHLPTGLQVVASDQRSQAQNKKNAKDRLEVLVQLSTKDKIKEKAKSGWLQHKQLNRGNPVRVFHGSDFKLKHEKNKNKERRSKDKQMLKKGRYED